jgi:hypothetical protein
MGVAPTFPVESDMLLPMHRYCASTSYESSEVGLAFCGLALSFLVGVTDFHFLSWSSLNPACSEQNSLFFLLSKRSLLFLVSTNLSRKS